MDTKNINPKDSIGRGKLPFHLVPSTLHAFAALGFLEGAVKYGRYNWRCTPVSMTVYLDALERHYHKVLNGEWEDQKTGIPHLASIIACAGIILDAYVCNTLVDDRPPAAPAAELIDLLAAEVQRIKDVFADHHPKQYSIADTDWELLGHDHSRIHPRVLPEVSRLRESEEATSGPQQGTAGSGKRREGEEGGRQGG